VLVGGWVGWGGGSGGNKERAREREREREREKERERERERERDLRFLDASRTGDGGGTLPPACSRIMQFQSMSLKYEPSSEPLHISGLGVSGFGFRVPPPPHLLSHHAISDFMKSQHLSTLRIPKGGTLSPTCYQISASITESISASVSASISASQQPDTLAVSGFVSFRGLGFGFRFWGYFFGVRVSWFEFRLSGFGLRVWGFGFRVSGLGCGVSGFGCREHPPNR